MYAQSGRGGWTGPGAQLSIRKLREMRVAAKQFKLATRRFAALKRVSWSSYKFRSINLCRRKPSSVISKRWSDSKGGGAGGDL